MTRLVRKTVVRRVTSCPHLGDLLAALLVQAQVRSVLDHSCPGEPCPPAAARAALGTWGFIGSALPSGTPDTLQEHEWKAAEGT